MGKANKVQLSLNCNSKLTNHTISSNIEKGSVVNGCTRSSALCSNVANEFDFHSSGRIVFHSGFLASCEVL